MNARTFIAAILATSAGLVVLSPLIVTLSLGDRAETTNTEALKEWNLILGAFLATISAIINGGSNDGSGKP